MIPSTTTSVSVKRRAFPGVVLKERRSRINP